jgi:hypothetical protein
MRKKLNRLESQALQKLKIERALSGTGRWLFMNRTKGEVILPKVGLDGKKRLQPKEQFIGDSYFFSLVPNMLLVVENLEKEIPVAQTPQVLLTEQPPVYTQKGHVEYVQEDPLKKKLVEQPNKAEGKLLIEPANDSVTVIR